MFIDKQLEFSSAQAVTASALSTNVLDLGPITKASKRNIGAGRPLFVVIRVDTTATAAGAGTVNFQLVTDTAVGGSYSTVIADSGSYGKAVLTAGRELIIIPIPDGALKYLALNYLVGTGPLTAGAFSAAVTLDAQRWTSYAKNYVV